MLFCFLALLLTCQAQSDYDISNESFETADDNTTLPPAPLAPEKNTTIDETVNIAAFLEEAFPIPSANLSQMVDAAKEFVRKYLTDAEWLKLKKLLRVIKEIGGNRRDTHRAISIYLGRVLSPEKRREIEDRKEELRATFGDF